jgi:hypothetical protein
MAQAIFEPYFSRINTRLARKLPEPIAQAIFEPYLSRINTPTFSNLVILHTYPPMKMEQSVPKRRNIKFRRREITQKEAYNIQNTAKVWNQVPIMFCTIFTCYNAVTETLQDAPYKK